MVNNTMTLTREAYSELEALFDEKALKLFNLIKEIIPAVV